MSLPDAFRELCAVCRPRPDLSDGGMEAAASRLFKALGEYPQDVALWALDAWPRHSDWFPTEHELRVFCERRMGEVARDEAAKNDPGQGRFLEPIGKTAYFAQRARAVMGEPWCKSWLAGGINCMFSQNIIFTTATGADRIQSECWGLLQESGVSVVVHKDAGAMLAKYCDRNQLTFEPRRKRNAA